METLASVNIYIYMYEYRLAVQEILEIFFNVFVKSPLLPLLYIQLTISFLIGRKRTVNFRNQRLGHHLAADYTMIMSRTLEVTGNHVMYDRGA